MTLKEIIEEVDNGGVFIGEYKDIKKICMHLGVFQLPQSLKYAELIEVTKIGESYKIQPCNNSHHTCKRKHKDKNCFTFYYGVSSKNQINTMEDLFQLEDKEATQHSNYIEVTANKGEYIYICYPSKYGTRKFIINGFEGGFNKTTIEIFDKSFDIYKSTNPNLGFTKIYIR